MKPIRLNSTANKAGVSAGLFQSSTVLSDAKGKGENSTAAVGSIDVGNVPLVLTAETDEVLAELLFLLEQAQELLK